MEIKESQEGYTNYVAHKLILLKIVAFFFNFEFELSNKKKRERDRLLSHF